MRVNRTTAFAGGVLAALVIGSGTAVATGNGSLVLGKGNVAAATTGLANSKGTPLSLAAKEGTPPLRVNNTVKVKNLDSDLLDGKDSTAFLGSSGTAADSAKLGGVPASGYLSASGTAANSTKLGGQPASSYLSASDTAANSNNLGGVTANAYGETYYAQTSVASDIGPAPKLGFQTLVQVVPSDGYWLATFTADLANPEASTGQFECQLVYGAGGGNTTSGYVGHITLSAGSAGSPTFGTVTITQMVRLESTNAVSAICFANSGDTGHTSYVYNSSLSTTRVAHPHSIYTLVTVP
jgi:hypothetical protein